MVWPLGAFPSQVPAFEALLDSVTTQCDVSVVALDRERGRLATKMIAGQAFLEKLSDGAAVLEVCDVLDKSSDITSAIIAAAAEKLHFGEAGSELVEVGVKLMIGGCPALLTRVV